MSTFYNRKNTSNALLASALESNDFIDVTLMAGDGGIVGAHRVILCAYSEVCSDLLLNKSRNKNEDDLADCAHRLHRHQHHPVLILSDVDNVIDLKNVVSFVYKGSVDVPRENLKGFLKAASILKISELTQHTDLSPRGKRKNSETCLLSTKIVKTEIMEEGNDNGGDDENEKKRDDDDDDDDNNPVIRNWIKLESYGNDGEEKSEEHEEEEIKSQAENHINSQDKSSEEGMTIQRGDASVDPPSMSKDLVVLFSEKGRCHFCHLLCSNSESLRSHLRSVHQPPRHALCENCENFFHICAIQRHRNKCTESYQSEKN